ncbi:retrovirus-related pol polyprotein from transposon TNT 1-94 [Tanacetum coccineum]
MVASSLVCLMSRATLTKSWLWHRMLSHMNFGTINQLTSKDLVDGLSKFKYNKDHLCLACKQGKSKKASLPPKLVPSTESKLELLHMDFCEPMRVIKSVSNQDNYRERKKVFRERKNVRKIRARVGFSARVNVVFDGAFGGVGDEEVVAGESMLVTSSSLDMLTNNCLGGIMVSLIFLEGLEEEALVEFMVELCEEDEDGRKNEKDGLFNLKANDQSRKA